MHLLQILVMGLILPSEGLISSLIQVFSAHLIWRFKWISTSNSNTVPIFCISFQVIVTLLTHQPLTTFRLFSNVNNSNQICYSMMAGSIKSLLPRPQDFSKALYVVDIGQNDLSRGFKLGSEAQVRAFIPIMIANYSQYVQVLFVS